ncbi:MAG TPA: VWA domain-containing protein [Bacteroidia bacterium]|nr:VWA domain-containing protein [Bacteroidia bacterium]HNT80915.1 VWA domain-containing protein [Bacteroidia bacterium]
MFNGIEFANPEFLWLLLILPLLIVYEIFYSERKRSEIKISGFHVLNTLRKTLKVRLRRLPFVLRLISIALLILAIARPQSSSSGQEVKTEGIGLVLAMDISGSMLAEDLKPNRIEAAKKVALDFLADRKNDMIGLVIFGGEAFTQCPITSDHSVLQNLMGNIKSGMLTDGTALGDGLATAVSRLKDSELKSKVIILLTDGVNNSGSVPPLTAGEIARTFGIRVYTIGVGSIGMAPYPFKTPFGIQYQNVEVQIDEATLKEISKITDGKYFRATNNKKLQDIYAEIDQMEKTKISVTEFRRYTEEYFPLALLALGVFVFELILRYLYFKSLP